MICNILIYTGVEAKYLVDGLEIFVLDEGIDFLVNKSTQVQLLSQQVNLLTKNPNLLANGSTRWPTPL